MCTNYDEKLKLWANVDEPPVNETIDVSNNQWIWDFLLKHGPKVAQVYIILIYQHSFN